MSEKCPNCDKAVSGFFAGQTLVPQSKTDFINTYLKRDKPGYCTTCAYPLLNEIATEISKEKANIEKRLQEIVHNIPILSSPAPNLWQYEVIDFVNAQTTSGTGFATELSRSFNDLFGGTSNTMNKKVSDATNLCKADLRIQCIKSGGNAVISADIDYNEIGSGSTNMLMVCMAGTAIKITDMTNIRNKDLISEVVDLTEKLDAISKAPKTA